MKARKLTAAVLASSMILGGSLLMSGCDPKTKDDETKETEETVIETADTTVEETTEATTEETTETATETTTEETTEDTTVETATETTDYVANIDDLEVESLSASNRVLKFHNTEDYSKVLKTEEALFYIPSGGTSDGKVTIEVNDASYVLDCYMDDVGSVGVAYLLMNGDDIYIYAQCSLMDDYCSLNVYKVAGGSVNFVGSMEGYRVFNYYLGAEFTDPENFELYHSAGQGSNMLIAGEFKVGEDGMPVSTNDVWRFMAYSPDASFYFEEDKVGLEVGKDGSVSSDEITVAAKDKFTLVSTDRETYVDIKTESSETVRIDITDIVKTAKEERGEYYDFFYAMYDLGVCENY